MPNKNYIKGRAFEYTIKKKLEAEGWTVWRTPGSKSKTDLICIKKMYYFESLDYNHTDVQEMTVVKFVQCKSGSARMSKKDKAELLELSESVGAEAMYAYKPKGRIIIEELS